MNKKAVIISVKVKNCNMNGGAGGKGGDLERRRCKLSTSNIMSYGTIGVLGGIGGYAVDPAVSNNNFRGKGGNGGNAIFVLQRQILILIAIHLL